MTENKVENRPALINKVLLATLDIIKQTIEEWDPDKLVDQLSSLLFKCVLFFAIPYFIYILVTFIMLK